MASKYESLKLKDLRDIVKNLGVKNTSVMRKAQLVEILDLEEKKRREQVQEKNNAEMSKEEKPEKTAAAKESEAAKETVAVKEAGEATASAPEAGDHDQEKPAPRRRGRPKGSGKKRVQNDAAQTDEKNEEAAAPEDSIITVKEEKPVGAETESAANNTPEEPEAFSTEAVSSGKKESTPEGEATEAEASSEEKASVQDQAGEIREQKEQKAKEQRSHLDSGNKGCGILEVMQDGFGFIRSANYMPGENDIYVSPAQIRKFNLKTGDIVEGNIKIKQSNEKFSALLYITAVNGFDPGDAVRRMNFDDMTPVFPDERIDLEIPGAALGMRMINIISPVGKGQRGMIVSPPKTGKTTLIKQIARSVHTNYPDMNMIILLIDERPEEVTDIKEYIEGENVEVIYSTFDESPEHHKRVSEMVLERAKRLVEHNRDVVILLDSITRMARAYNLTVAPSGRTLSGGLDPAALYMPKKFFGAARNMREGGSLTVLATALVDTGSKMDDVVFEEFKGTGNMELVLDRRLSERRIFPSIDIAKSGTRREDLLLSKEELNAAYVIRKSISTMRTEEAAEHVINLFKRTKGNAMLCEMLKHNRVL